MNSSENTLSDDAIDSAMQIIASKSILLDTEISKFIDKLSNDKLTKDHIKKYIANFNRKFLYTVLDIIRYEVSDKEKALANLHLSSWDDQASDFMDKIPENKINEDRVKKTLVHFSILTASDYLSYAYLDMDTHEIEKLIIESRNEIMANLMN